MPRAGDPPDQGAQHASAVEWEAGQHVEAGEEAVEDAEDEDDVVQRGIGGQRRDRNDQEDQPEN